MDAIQRNRGKDQGSAGASPHLISLTHRTPRFIGEQENLFHQFTFSRVSRFLFQSQIANQKSLHVVAPEGVVVADVKAAVDGNGIGPGFFHWVRFCGLIGGGESAFFFVTIR